MKPPLDSLNGCVITPQHAEDHFAQAHAIACLLGLAAIGGDMPTRPILIAACDAIGDAILRGVTVTGEHRLRGAQS